MSTDPYEKPSKLKIGSLQQNLPFKGKGWHTQQKPRATIIQPMDYREVQDRHRLWRGKSLGDPLLTKCVEINYPISKRTAQHQSRNQENLI